MKHLFIVLAAALFTFAAAAVPNEKVLGNFNHAFPKADSVSWFDQSSGYEVRFINQAVRCILWYDEDGNVTRAHRYYQENLLPPLIKSRVHLRYPGRTIFGITEVSTSSEGIKYHIVLEDEKKWYNITSDEFGNVSLTKKFNKA